MYELKFNKKKNLLENHIYGGSFSLCPVFFHYWIVIGLCLFPPVLFSRFFVCVLVCFFACLEISVVVSGTGFFHPILLD